MKELENRPGADKRKIPFEAEEDVRSLRPEHLMSSSSSSSSGEIITVNQQNPVDPGENTDQDVPSIGGSEDSSDDNNVLKTIVEVTEPSDSSSRFQTPENLFIAPVPKKVCPNKPEDSTSSDSDPIGKLKVPPMHHKKTSKSSSSSSALPNSTNTSDDRFFSVSASSSSGSGISSIVSDKEEEEEEEDKCKDETTEKQETPKNLENLPTTSKSASNPQKLMKRTAGIHMDEILLENETPTTSENVNMAVDDDADDEDSAMSANTLTSVTSMASSSGYLSYNYTRLGSLSQEQSQSHRNIHKNNSSSSDNTSVNISEIESTCANSSSDNAMLSSQSCVARRLAAGSSDVSPIKGKTDADGSNIDPKPGPSGTIAARVGSNPLAHSSGSSGSIGSADPKSDPKNIIHIMADPRCVKTDPLPRKNSVKSLTSSQSDSALDGNLAPFPINVNGTPLSVSDLHPVIPEKSLLLRKRRSVDGESTQSSPPAESDSQNEDSTNSSITFTQLREESSSSDQQMDSNTNDTSSSMNSSVMMNRLSTTDNATLPPSEDNSN